jgi:hypothetical protein
VGGGRAKFVGLNASMQAAAQLTFSRTTSGPRLAKAAKHASPWHGYPFLACISVWVSICKSLADNAELTVTQFEELQFPNGSEDLPEELRPNSTLLAVRASTAVKAPGAENGWVLGEGRTNTPLPPCLSSGDNILVIYHVPLLNARYLYEPPRLGRGYRPGRHAGDFCQLLCGIPDGRISLRYRKPPRYYYYYYYCYYYYHYSYSTILLLLLLLLLLATNSTPY